MTNYIYLGPTIPGTAAIQNTIFSYKPEKIIAKASETEPLAKYLFVDMTDIVEKKKELNKDGSLLNVAYKKLIKSLTEV